MYRTFPIWTRE
ncbi:unnamed protein product, partial [Allacma fusca]